ncbi:unnamed protein product [Mortierella alpina]
MQSSEDQFTHRPMDQDTSTPLSPTDRHPITDNDSTVPTENSDHEFDNKRTNDIDSRSRESQPSTKSLSETTDEESSTPASTVASSSGTTSGSTPDIVASTAASHDRHVKRKESKEQYDMMKVHNETLREFLFPLCHNGWTLFLTNENRAMQHPCGMHSAVLRLGRTPRLHS